MEELRAFYSFNRRNSTIACSDRYVIIVTTEGEIATSDLHFSRRSAYAIQKQYASRAVHVSSAYYGTAVILENGEMHLFGIKSQDYETERTSYPLQFHKNIISVSVGDNNLGFITEDGQLYTFGDNTRGQLGIDEETKYTSTPTFVSFKEPIVQVSCGAYHTAVITESGKLYAFGRNQFDAGAVHESAEAFYGNVIKVECGFLYTYIIAEGGELHILGYKGYYNTLVESTEKLVDICMRDYYLAGITESGKLVQVIEHSGEFPFLSLVATNEPMRSLACRPSGAITVDFEGIVFYPHINSYLSFGDGDARVA